jgi:hypothetical protein
MGKLTVTALTTLDNIAEDLPCGRARTSVTRPAV